MIRARLNLLALVLPLAGLAGLWAWSDYRSRQGSDWLVPIEGYDPRDLLRGHYVEFAYAWPGEDAFDDEFLREFCIEGAAPRIERIVPVPSGGSCAHYARANDGGIYRTGGLRRGRIYIAQDKAAELQASLRDPAQRGFVLIRLRDDGRVTPRELRFEPAPPPPIMAPDAPAGE